MYSSLNTVYSYNIFRQSLLASSHQELEYWISASTHSYSSHIRLLSHCTSHVSYSRLTVWDGSSAVSRQLCHGVHAVQYSSVLFVFAVQKCSAMWQSVFSHAHMYVCVYIRYACSATQCVFSHQHRHGIPLSLLKSNISPLLTPHTHICDLHSPQHGRNLIQMFLKAIDLDSSLGPE